MKFNWMIKNSKGEFDGTWSLAVYSWLIVSFCMIVSLIDSVTGKNLSFSIKGVESSVLLGYLATMTGGHLINKSNAGKLEVEKLKINSSEHQNQIGSVNGE